MKKEAAINPFDTYHKYVGRQPVLDTAMSGGIGTILGYTGANVLLNPLISLIAGMTGADPAKVEAVKNKLKSYGGIAGGVGGLLYGSGKHMDTGSGIKGWIQSMTDADYWKKNPAAANRKLQKFLENLQTGKKSIRTPDVFGFVHDTLNVPTQEDTEVFELQAKEIERQRKKQLLEQARKGLVKTQALEDATLGGGHLPMDYAMSVIASDPFLSMGQKVVTGGIMADADDPTDAGSLMTSALRFGAAAVPAYLFGRGVSNIMGLPPEKINALSSVGGVAAGILNTGIFGD